MVELIDIFASISTLLFYLSPFSVFILLHLKKIELKYISGSVIMCALTHATLRFTLDKKNDNTLLYVCDIIAFAFCFFWFVFYLYYYTEGNKNLFKYIIYILTVGNIIGELIYIENDIIENNNNTGEVTIFEYLTALFQILMYISPGLNFIKFVSEWNQKYICLAMNITGLLNSIVYFNFGFYSEKKNYYLIISNGISIGICLFFIVFYIINRKKVIEPDEPNDDFEENNIKGKLNSGNKGKNTTDKKKKVKKSKKLSEEVLEYF